MIDARNTITHQTAIGSTEMTAKIERVHAKEIQAERGLLALRVTVEADDGSVGVSTPSSGVSTGTFEAKFLLDGEERYKGLGVARRGSGWYSTVEPL